MYMYINMHVCKYIKKNRAHKSTNIHTEYCWGVELWVLLIFFSVLPKSFFLGGMGVMYVIAVIRKKFILKS